MLNRGAISLPASRRVMHSLLGCTYIILLAVLLPRRTSAAVTWNAEPQALRQANWTTGAPWNGAEVILVVTWYRSPPTWLEKIPFETLPSLKVAMFCKQDENSTSSCDRVSPRVKAALAICHELPNAGAFRSLRLQICTNTIGANEQHTLAKFFNDFYDNLPRIIVNAQDDCDRSGDCPPGRILSSMKSPEDLAALVERIEADPFEGNTCLCAVNIEARFRPCDPFRPFKVYPIEASCYGDKWYQITFLWNMTGRRSRSESHVIRWADQGQFAVPAYVVRALPRMAFAVIEYMTDGKYVEGVVSTVDSTLAYSPIHRRVFECGGPFTSREWGHALERFWFGLLDPHHEAHIARDEHIAHEVYDLMRRDAVQELREQLGPDAHGTTDEGLVY